LKLRDYYEYAEFSNLSYVLWRDGVDISRESNFVLRVTAANAGEREQQS